ncbi:MAG TPA: 2-oxoacid:acceptor oxidoreductase subunit alpha [Sedimenticola thiotaurini]|uniref:2-oxoacid:acceptor oxidoreductase subunit alpha n=1 Tax=Sedimenticola thiotaurini TaxID=1543721 RepID=A0A831RNP3_9GAMM|nr:2-oxoacid:acceptor oxidoreductase subunit alpha [Sedimenticola thiotaurini]
MQNNHNNAPHPTLSVAITGSGGSGVVTAGHMLLQAVAGAGYYGLMARSAGPQIRGGESAAMLRIAPRRVDCLDDSYQLLIALDWLNANRFAEEIPLTGDSVIVCDPAAGEIPPEIATYGARVMEMPLKELAKGIDGGRINMVALGILCDLLGLPQEAMLAVVEQTLARKGEQVVQASQTCVRVGYDSDKPLSLEAHLPAVDAPPPRWNISGNEASGLGAVRGGVRFVAAYPITPASEVLEWLAPNLERLGGSLLQAEDELASINMIIGASFGGVPALTATSGPGLALMMEGLGLAVASETPVVVANVMRGGPSTGIPTKSEQSDLNIALCGFHGDAPHLVLSALDIADCTFTTEWAVRLSESLQATAIVLTDQSLGQARALVDPPRRAPAGSGRRTAPPCDEPYLRYRLTDDGVSPMAIPGTDCDLYTADGLEHNEKGTPSSAAQDHQRQLDKRLRKLAGYDYGGDWARISGSGEHCIVTWGSSAGAAEEAARRLTAAGTGVRVIAIRLISPLPVQAMGEALTGVRRVLVVEQNHGGQLFHYLHSLQLLPADAGLLARPGPLPLRPAEIVARMTEEM